MSTKQTIAITNSSQHIILTWSGGDIKYVPKANLSIAYKPDTGRVDNPIFLNWPSGDYPQAYDDQKLLYTDISSPTVASQAALLALLAGYAADIDMNVDTVAIPGCYIGKSGSGARADFSVSYNAANQLGLTGYPSPIIGFTALDIEAVRQIDSTGAVVKTYTRDDTAMSIATHILTVTGANFAITDSFVVFTNVTRDVNVDLTSATGEFLIGKSSGGTRGDFSVEYLSDTILTISNFPYDLTGLSDIDIEFVRQIDSTGEVVKTYTRDDAMITITTSNLSVAGASFSNGDSYVVGTNVPRNSANDAAAIAVAYYGQDVIDDGEAYEGVWKALQVLSITTFTTLTDNGDNPSTGQTGVAFPAGSYLTANGFFTNVEGDAAALYILIRGNGAGGIVTTTTTTTSTTTTTTTT